MLDKDLLIKKYEYDTVYKLELEDRLREENAKFQDMKSRIEKKNLDFEKVRSEFLEKKNQVENKNENNFQFLQKRIKEKYSDLEKNQKVMKDLEGKRNTLLNSLNKSNKTLEIIYKKIEDIKLTQKIRKENIETSENLETFLVNKRFKDLEKNELKTKNLNNDEGNNTFFEVQNENNDKVTFDTSNNFETSKDDVKNVIVEQSLSSNLSFENNNPQNHNPQKEKYLSFEEFKERIDSLNVQNFENGSSLSLEYTSEAGGTFNINLLDNLKTVDVTINVKSYRDFLNLNKEKTRILNLLKDKGLNIKDIILRQSV